MKKLNKIVSFFAICLLTANALANNEEKFFVSGNYGLTGPLKPKFKDKESNSIFSIKRSQIFTGSLGYKITPEISVEIAGEYKPKYTLGIRLPEDKGGDYVSTPAKGKVAMLNFFYDLAPLSDAITPFFMIGVGVAEIDPKPTINGFVNQRQVILDNVPAAARPLVNALPAWLTPLAPKMTTQRHKSKSFAWQVGLGASKKISDSLTLDFSGRIQIAHDVELKYVKYDSEEVKKKIAAALSAIASGAPVRFSELASYKPGKTKKTLGMAEVTVGFTYILP